MRWRHVAIGLLAAGLPLAAALAHIVYGKATVYQLTVDADLVVRARILDPAAVVVQHEPPARRPVVVAEIVELYKGEADPGRVRFAQHGHGVAQYESGEEVLLFLRRIERSRELADLAAGGEVPYVSLQEHDAKFALTPETRPAFAAAARAYAALAAVEDPADRLESLRRLTCELLASAEPRLAASALGDVVLFGDALLTRESLPRFEPLIDEPTVAIGVRLALLAELERRGLVEAAPRWARLLETARDADLLAVVRAAGAHPSPPVVTGLLRHLGAEDPELASAAAIALGVPANHAAVAPLAQALAAGAPRLRMAAIRGLGGVGTEEALAALRRAAAAHPDPATRRRARAEVVRAGGEDD